MHARTRPPSFGPRHAARVRHPRLRAHGVGAAGLQVALATAGASVRNLLKKRASKAAVSPPLGLDTPRACATRGSARTAWVQLASKLPSQQRARA